MAGPFLKSRQGHRALHDRALQFLRIQSQRLQHRDGDLSRAHCAAEALLLEPRVAHQAGDVSVVDAQSTVLGHLCGRRRVAGAQRRADDDVRHRGIGGGVPEPLRGEVGAVDQLGDVQQARVGLQVLHALGRVGRVVEEDEADVVGRDEGGGHAGGVHKRGGVDDGPQAALNGRLAVLARDDDQGLGQEGFGLELRDHFADGAVDKVHSLQDRRGHAAGAVVVVADGLLGDRDGLEVAAEEGGGLIGGERGPVGGGVDGCYAVDPVEPGVDVELVVGDGGVHVYGDGGDFGEVAHREARAAGPAHDVVCWVFVGVGGF